MRLKIFGIAMERDEDDIIVLTVRRMSAQGLDHLIVTDNLSKDKTRRILDRLAKELPETVLDDPEPAHYQSEKMSALASRAATAGADWIVPFDADELWRACGGKTVREAIVESSHDVLQATVFNHQPRPTLAGARSSGGCQRSNGSSISVQ